MQTLTQLIVDAGLSDRILDEKQVSRLAAGTPQRRYNLVNRAVSAGELIRLKRGLYVLANYLRSAPPHPFALSQRLEPGSYVSMESALAHYGWVPEAVYSVTCVLPGRKRKAYQLERLGHFTFSPLAITHGMFLECVLHQQIDGQTFLIANPLRALMDLVCLRKVRWQGAAWLEEGLRVDPDAWSKVTSAEIRALRNVYQHKRAQQFLAELEVSLGLELNHE